MTTIIKPTGKIHNFFLNLITFTIWGLLTGSMLFWYLKLTENSRRIPVPEYTKVVSNETSLPHVDPMILFGPSAISEIIHQPEPIINKIKVAGIMYHQNINARFIMISFIDKNIPSIAKIYRTGDVLIDNYVIKNIDLDSFTISNQKEDIKLEMKKDPLVEKYPNAGIYISAKSSDKSNLPLTSNLTVVPQSIQIIDGEEHIVDQDVAEEQKNNGGFTNFGTKSVF